jgi:hypothetical protein
LKVSRKIQHIPPKILQRCRKDSLAKFFQHYYQLEQKLIFVSIKLWIWTPLDQSLKITCGRRWIHGKKLIWMLNWERLATDCFKWKVYLIKLLSFLWWSFHRRNSNSNFFSSAFTVMCALRVWLSKNK